jgi:hypothetical protein
MRDKGRSEVFMPGEHLGGGKSGKIVDIDRWVVRESIRAGGAPSLRWR